VSVYNENNDAGSKQMLYITTKNAYICNIGTGEAAHRKYKLSSGQSYNCSGI